MTDLLALTGTLTVYDIGGLSMRTYEIELKHEQNKLID